MGTTPLDTLKFGKIKQLMEEVHEEICLKDKMKLEKKKSKGIGRFCKTQKVDFGCGQKKHYGFKKKRKFQKSYRGKKKKCKCNKFPCTCSGKYYSKKKFKPRYKFKKFMKSSGKSKPKVRCYICDGAHYATSCQKRQIEKEKSRVNFVSYFCFDDEAYDIELSSYCDSETNEINENFYEVSENLSDDTDSESCSENCSKCGDKSTECSFVINNAEPAENHSDTDYFDKCIFMNSFYDSLFLSPEELKYQISQLKGQLERVNGGDYIGRWNLTNELRNKENSQQKPGGKESKETKEVQTEANQSMHDLQKKNKGKGKMIQTQILDFGTFRNSIIQPNKQSAFEIYKSSEFYKNIEKEKNIYEKQA